MEIQVDHVAGDPFGQLSGGYILVRARVVPSEWMQRPLRLDDNEGDVEVDGKMRLKYEICGMATSRIHFDDEGSASLPALDNIVLIPAVRERGRTAHGREQAILGLVLCRADESRYRRVGMFKITASVGEREFAKWPESTLTVI